MKKAYVIISTEYYKNQPSIFLFIEGVYYGCLTYPRFRKWPQDVCYWAGATSSDSDRGFTIRKVEVSDEQLTEIRKYQDVINACDKCTVRTSWPHIKKEWKVKRGKAYEAYKKATNEQIEAIELEEKTIRPYITASSAAFRTLRDLLLKLK